MKDICFLSTLYPKGCENYDINVKKHRSQNITFIQNELIRGFEESFVNKVHIINKLLVPLYKKGYTKPFVKSGAFEHTNGLNEKDIIFPYVNVPLFHSISLFWGVRKYLLRWILNEQKEKYLISYSLTTYSLKAMKYAKKKSSTIKTCIIVPDIPQFTYMNTNNLLIKIKNKIALNLLNNKIKKSSKYVDTYCFFSEHMQEKINAKHFCVFEGLATEGFSNIAAKRDYSEKEKVILYAGGLHANYGVDLLLNAFTSLKNPNYRLILCGKGSLEEKIIKQSSKDHRINFVGEIDRLDLLSLEKGADLLINPRIDCGIFTRYSFPSKNLEYLSSGTPLIAYKLEGIPSEYDKYINYFNEPTAESLAVKIVDILENNNISAINTAANAALFVTTQKNASLQSKKIIEAMDNL